jgi:hypothetical protein
MAYPGMLCRVALVRTDVSEELSACFIRVTRNGELGTTLVFSLLVRVAPDLISIQLCTSPKLFMYNSSHTQSIFYI